MRCLPFSLSLYLAPVVVRELVVPEAAEMMLGAGFVDLVVGKILWLAFGFLLIVVD